MVVEVRHCATQRGVFPVGYNLLRSPGIAADACKRSIGKGFGNLPGSLDSQPDLKCLHSNVRMHTERQETAMAEDNPTPAQLSEEAGSVSFCLRTEGGEVIDRTPSCKRYSGECWHGFGGQRLIRPQGRAQVRAPALAEISLSESLNFLFSAPEVTTYLYSGRFGLGLTASTATRSPRRKATCPFTRTSWVTT